MAYSQIIDEKEFIGASTDEKPIHGVTAGSNFYEYDTGDTYIFDLSGWTLKEEAP